MPLSPRALNRATLTRQLLVERAAMSVPDALTHLAGLQAQEPLEPYTGLWSRLEGFDPSSLSSMIADRSAVRLHLMRRTVHLMTTADALAWRGAHDAMLRQRLLGVRGKELAGVDLDDLAEAGRPVLEQEPQQLRAAGRALADRFPGTDPVALGDGLTAALPLVQVPPRGLWGRTGPAAHTTVHAWLGREHDDGSVPVLAGIVRRYLAAFGPAASADVRAWSGVAGLPEAIATLDLRRDRDERGRELLDLPDAPPPDPDLEVPPRFLPAFDNAVLGYDDRSRIIDDEHKGLSVKGTRFVLVDGRVAATWTVTDGVLGIRPLVRVSRADRSAVIAEGHALQTFLNDGTDAKVRWLART